MNILESLDSTYNKIINDTGSAPRKALYLGARQHHQLAAALRPNVPFQVAGDGPRLKFADLPVFRVDAGDHLQFA